MSHRQIPWAHVAVAAGKLRGSWVVSLWVDPVVAPFCCSSLCVVMEMRVLNEARFMGITFV